MILIWYPGGFERRQLIVLDISTRKIILCIVTHHEKGQQAYGRTDGQNPNQLERPFYVLFHQRVEFSRHKTGAGQGEHHGGQTSAKNMYLVNMAQGQEPRLKGYQGKRILCRSIDAVWTAPDNQVAVKANGIDTKNERVLILQQ